MLKCMFCKRTQCRYDFKDTGIQVLSPQEKPITLPAVPIAPRENIRSISPVSMKCASLGTAIISGRAEAGTVHNIAALSLDVCKEENLHIELHFTTLVILKNTRCNLTFQVVKQWEKQALPAPLSPRINYCRTEMRNEANPVSLYACDFDLNQNGLCCYSVYAEVSGPAVPTPVFLSNCTFAATIFSK